MANDFSQAKIIEYWLFENNLTAGKAGNDLTGVNALYESGSPLEGSYSFKCEKSWDRWAKRTDTNLSAGFPLKNGDTTKKVSWTCKFKPASVNQQGWLISKYGTGKRSLGLYITSAGNLSLVWGYNNGDSGEAWSIAAVSAGTEYHVGVAVDGIARTALVRLWNGSAASTYTKDDWGADLHVEDADFVIGNAAFYSTAEDYDGLIDEVVVANDLLSADEFDQIRQGIFPNIVGYIDEVISLCIAEQIIANQALLNEAYSLSIAEPMGARYTHQSFIIF